MIKDLSEQSLPVCLKVSEARAHYPDCFRLLTRQEISLQLKLVNLVRVLTALFCKVAHSPSSASELCPGAGGVLISAVRSMIEVADWVVKWWVRGRDFAAPQLLSPGLRGKNFAFTSTRSPQSGPKLMISSLKKALIKLFKMNCLKVSYNTCA